MKANAWRKYLDEQRERHGKVLFTVTELANVAGVSRAALNVELARLREQEVIMRYAHGLYGPPAPYRHKPWCKQSIRMPISPATTRSIRTNS